MWKRNHTTNGCWIVCKQLGLQLSDAAKVDFQKQGGSLKKKCKTYSEEEINTMIFEKVEVAMKASDTDTKQIDKGDTESINMEEFICDPASESEHELYEVWGKEMIENCNDNTKDTIELSKDCILLDATFNRCFASSTIKQ